MAAVASPGNFPRLLFLRLLKDRVDLFREARRTRDRGNVEKTVLLRGVRPELGKDHVDRVVADVISAAVTYEQTTSFPRRLSQW